MGTIITGVVLGLVAIVGIIYSIFLFREKGPILTNTFLLFTEEERKKMKIDMHKEYRQTAIVYMMLSMGLFFSSIATLTMISWFFAIAIVLIVILIVYTIVSWIKFENKTH